MLYTLRKKDRTLKGEIHLDGSKSISNRALLIRALCGQHFDIHHLSTSDDTVRMQALLSSQDDNLDAGAAGTTFRFLTAYLATKGGSQTLTGSARMKQRPIGALVSALNHLGADIQYLENENCPPLQINAPLSLGQVNEISVPADTSSQFISALLMIAPALPGGLTIHLEGEIVSRPYIEMTLRVMGHFHAKHSWEGNTIRVLPQPYQANDFVVEADWSAASYWYAMAAFADECHLVLHGLSEESWQGDSVLPKIMTAFGVESTFEGNRLYLKKSGQPPAPVFEQDFLACPDIAQTLAVVCAGLGVQGVFSGMDTLRIKETDRINTLQIELYKVQAFLSLLPGRFSKKSNKDYYMLDGKAAVQGCPVFATYHDHRMAMSFAPLSMFGEIKIEDPEVVRKSYPAFWEDMRKVGFEIHGEFLAIP